MKKRDDLNEKQLERRARRAYGLFACLVAALALTLTPALAATGNDPLTVVNNLSDFVFSLIRAIGLILLGVGGLIQPTTSALLHNTSTLLIGMQSMKNLLPAEEEQM